MKTALICIALVFASATVHADPKPSLQSLAKARVDAAVKMYSIAEKQWESGAATLDVVLTWSVRWFDAAHDAATKPADAKAAADDHVARMQALQQAVDSHYKASLASADQVSAVAYYVAEALYWQAKGSR